MSRVRRIDLGSLAAPTKRADGTLVAEARLTRSGVFTYRNADGTTRREYRPPDQVFDSKSLASFKLVPLTNNHPPVMLTADNARQYSVGAVGQDIRRDGDHVVATIAVHDAATIADMQRGKTQVSNGYDCDLVDAPGISPEGERYDAVQTNIVGNHVAIVDSARAGKDAAVRMDAAWLDTSEPVTPTREQRKDNAMTLEQALAALAAAQEKVGAERARADKAEAELRVEHARADKLEGERDAAKSRADAADKARTDAAAGEGLRVRARVDLVTKSTKVLGDAVTRADGTEVKTDSLTDREIKLAVIKHVTDADCSVDSAGKPRSDEYVDARYDAAIERASASEETFRQALDVIEDGRADTLERGSASRDKARQDMIDSNRNAWRNDADAQTPTPKAK